MCMYPRCELSLLKISICRSLTSHYYSLETGIFQRTLPHELESDNLVEITSENVRSDPDRFDLILEYQADISFKSVPSFRTQHPNRSDNNRCPPGHNNYTGLYGFLSVAELIQVNLCEPCLADDSPVVQAFLQHGAGNFQRRFTLTFNAALHQTFFNPLLLQLLGNRHQFILMLRHSLRQVAYEGFGVVGFARLYEVVYQRKT